jgi:hypothetical protein
MTEKELRAASLSELVDLRIYQLIRQIVEMLQAQGKAIGGDAVATELAKIVFSNRRTLDGHALLGSLIYHGAYQYVQHELGEQVNDDSVLPTNRRGTNKDHTC